MCFDKNINKSHIYFVCGAGGAAQNGTRLSTTLLCDAEAVVVSPEKCLEALDLNPFVEQGLDVLLVLEGVVAVSPVDGTAGLITLEQWSVADDHPPRFGGGSDIAVEVGAVVGLENLSRGLDNKVVLAIVEVEQYSRSILLRLHRLHLLLVAGSDLPAVDVLAPLDMQTGLLRCIGGYCLPTLSVVLTNPTLVVAVQVAHLVEQAVAVLLLVPIPKEGNLDADAPAVPPIELPELATSVVESDFDGREFVAENLLVELLEPSLHLSECRCHSISFLITLQRYDIRATSLENWRRRGCPENEKARIISTQASPVTKKEFNLQRFSTAECTEPSISFFSW